MNHMRNEPFHLRLGITVARREQRLLGPDGGKPIALSCTSATWLNSGSTVTAGAPANARYVKE